MTNAVVFMIRKKYMLFRIADRIQRMVDLFFVLLVQPVARQPDKDIDDEKDYADADQAFRVVIPPEQPARPGHDRIQRQAVQGNPAPESLPVPLVAVAQQDGRKRAEDRRQDNRYGMIPLEGKIVSFKVLNDHIDPVQAQDGG